ncbi:hypothetical protein OAJ82_02130 [Alphaproteobacteria bacterium]|nr:hypothetical protein [Alphaproteobacteria bacterium]
MKINHYIENKHSKFIIISGEDKKKFLQSIITNNIDRCTQNNLIYSCLLTPQGRFFADFFISEHQNIYLIEIDKLYFDSFFEKLLMYKLRSKVEISFQDNFLSFVIFQELDFIREELTYIYKDPRHQEIGTKVYINKDSKNLKKLNELKKINYESYRDLLMQHLIPNSTYDLIQNKSLLLENNFENINAIDWEKGCYVGQELTARMKYRGLLKKKIHTLKITSGNIKISDKVFDDEVEIGEVISKTDNYILAMLRINLIENLIGNKKIISTSEGAKVSFLLN